MRLHVLAERDVDPKRRALAGALAHSIEGEVLFGRHERMLYATDASIYQVEPLGVVLPRTRADLERVVHFCRDHGLPLLARGGGTSLAGQTVNRAVVVDVSRHLDHVIEIDRPSRRARVEPGVVLDVLNTRARSLGLMFGPDVATSTHATIGGMIGNNSAGAHSILYGRTVEHLVALDVLLADGSAMRLDEGASLRDERVAQLTAKVAEIVLPIAAAIDERYPKTRRHVNGYNLDLILAQLRASTPGTHDRVNLAHLLCGSEGTLAVTCEATLALVEAPRSRALAIVGYAGVDEALQAVSSILETGPAAVELLDDVIIELAAANLEHRAALDLLPPGPSGPARAVLYVEYFGDGAESNAARIEALRSHAHGGVVRPCLEPQAALRAWRLRKAGEPLLHGRPGRRKPATFIEDTAVDPARLGEFVRRFRAIVSKHGTTASYYAHASVGCLHIRPLVDVADEADLEIVQSIVTEVTDLVIEFGGALSGEHGDGRLRSHLLERFYGPEICNAFREIKRIFDPDGRLNPGNIVEPHSMTEALRVRPDAARVVVPPVKTFFRYEREHGFEGAVEQCNGAGVCRRLGGGTMCPSYRATRDERHATRGRANGLRLAITGQLGNGAAPAWNDPETLRTLDLCLSCKACKSECPSNVDVARLKAEYLAQGYRAGARIPLAVRAFASVRTLNRLGSLWPSLSNSLARSPIARAAAVRALGLDPRRSLPPFAEPLRRWLRRHREARREDATAPTVILWPDCFVSYSEPEIGRSAIEVLERLGYRVVVPRVGCCGRPMISNGLLERAMKRCAASARTLIEAAKRERAVAIVGCEPSCLSAITDDWVDLDLDERQAPLDERQWLAERTRPIESFLVAPAEPHPRPLPEASRDRTGTKILVHAHCHQRALYGAAPPAQLLDRATGAEVVALDAGCCGMAGAFGYTADHYPLSMEIGELALFPALRAEPGARVAATGTSCRHQIRDALGMHAVHPIELVAHALGQRQAT